MGDGSGIGNLLAMRYSSSSVSFSASATSVGKWYSISSEVSDSKFEVTGELGGRNQGCGGSTRRGL